ncbi:hypothetical protein [Brucella gallinifaecis]|uniref:hypothetical protein n=1 Tax=Brucella gallinifaecis TaxID=215590 RepID=UPI00235E4CF3|nr:hypothetical protein [Brucella gallinifaecis]
MSSRRKKEISIREFSIDREQSGIIITVIKCIFYGSIAIFGDWLLYVAIRDDWHIGFFFFAPLFAVSVLISLFPVIIAGVVIWALFLKLLADDKRKPDSRQIFIDTLQADIRTLAKNKCSSRLRMSTEFQTAQNGK